MSAWQLPDSDDEAPNDPTPDNPPLPQSIGMGEPAQEVRRRGPGRPRGSKNVATILKRRPEIDVADLRRDSEVEPAVGPPMGLATASSADVSVFAGAKGAITSHGPQHEGMARFVATIDPTKPHRLLLNASALAVAAGIDRRRVPEMLSVVGDTLRNDEELGVNQLVEMIGRLRDAQRVCPVSIVIRRKYDETPLRLMVRWAPDGANECESSAKLMLTECSWCITAQLLAPDGTVQGQVCLRGRRPTRAQVMSAMTAEAVQHVVSDACPLPAAVRSVFPHVDVVSTTDEHASNVAAELNMIDALPDGSAGGIMHLLCDVHKASAIAKKSLGLDEPTITGCIKVAMSVRGSGTMTKLRRCMTRFLLDFTERRAGHAGIDAQRRRELMLNTFLTSQSPGERSLRVGLVELLNGDWSSPVPVHYCNGCCTSVEEMQQKLRKHVVGGLLRRCVKIFPRNNWCGSDETLDQVGVMVAAHNLLYSAMAYCFKWPLLPGLRCEGDRPGVAAAVVAAQPQGMAAQDDDDVVLGDDQLDVDEPGGASAGAAEHGIVPFEAVLPDFQAAVPDATELFRRQIAAARVAAKAFLLKESTPQKLFAARRQLEPQSALMKQMLVMSAPKWERRQLVCLAQTGHRKHRMLLALNCALTKPFMDRVQRLLLDEWGMVPKPTIEFCSEAFRMVARSGAVCFSLLITRHRKYPFRLFHLLEPHDPEFAEEVWDERPCLLDPWSRRFLSSCSSSADLSSDVVLLRLQALVEMSHIDTVSVEREHAGNLRRAKARDTRAQTVEDLAAWMTVRTSLPEMFSAPRPPRQTSSASARRSSASGSARAIGPWRAFVSERTSQNVARGRVQWTREELKALKAEYVQLTPDQKHHFIELGHAMSLARAVGSNREKAQARGAKEKQARQVRGQLLAEAQGIGQPSGGDVLVSRAADSLDMRRAAERADALARVRQELCDMPGVHFADSRRGAHFPKPGPRNKKKR